MTPLEEKIIENFNNQFVYKGGFTDEDNARLSCCLKEKVEQFLLASIKEVQEETRKETLKTVNRLLKSETDMYKFHIHNDFLHLEITNLSLTTKEEE